MIHGSDGLIAGGPKENGTGSIIGRSNSIETQGAANGHRGVLRRHRNLIHKDKRLSRRKDRSRRLRGQGSLIASRAGDPNLDLLSDRLSGDGVFLSGGSFELGLRTVFVHHDPLVFHRGVDRHSVYRQLAAHPRRADHRNGLEGQGAGLAGGGNVHIARDPLAGDGKLAALRVVLIVGVRQLFATHRYGNAVRQGIAPGGGNGGGEVCKVGGGLGRAGSGNTVGQMIDRSIGPGNCRAGDGDVADNAVTEGHHHGVGVACIGTVGKIGEGCTGIGVGDSDPHRHGVTLVRGEGEGEFLAMGGGVVFLCTQAAGDVGKVVFNDVGLAPKHRRNGHVGDAVRHGKGVKPLGRCGISHDLTAIIRRSL